MHKGSRQKSKSSLLNGRAIKALPPPPSGLMAIVKYKYKNINLFQCFLLLSLKWAHANIFCYELRGAVQIAFLFFFFWSTQILVFETRNMIFFIIPLSFIFLWNARTYWNFPWKISIFKNHTQKFLTKLIIDSKILCCLHYSWLKAGKAPSQDGEHLASTSSKKMALQRY